MVKQKADPNRRYERDARNVDNGWQTTLGGSFGKSLFHFLDTGGVKTAGKGHQRDVFTLMNDQFHVASPNSLDVLAIL